MGTLLFFEKSALFRKIEASPFLLEVDLAFERQLQALAQRLDGQPSGKRVAEKRPGHARPDAHEIKPFEPREGHFSADTPQPRPDRGLLRRHVGESAGASHEAFPGQLRRDIYRLDLPSESGEVPLED